MINIFYCFDQNSVTITLIVDLVRNIINRNLRFSFIDFKDLPYTMTNLHDNLFLFLFQWLQVLSIAFLTLLCFLIFFFIQH